MYMNLKRMANYFFLMICLFLSLSVTAQTQTKPLWVQKGEKSLEKKPTNESYYFKIFNTYGMDVNLLEKQRFQPLLEHICDRYQADLAQIKLDSLYLSNDSSKMTYRITFTDSIGNAVVYAEKVDEYRAFEDYVDNTYQFEYYQLYAISKRDSVPVFDEFTLSRTYNYKAVCLSLIPGLGQIYKGQKIKGYAILGMEATLVVSAVAFHFKKHYCDKQISEQPQFADSWRSKSLGWRQMRNLCFGVAGCLYVYNLIDAALSKGSRHVVVKKPKLQVLPSASPEGAGMTLSFNF